MALFADADVPFAPVNKVDEVVADPQAEHLGLFVPVSRANGGGDRAVRPAIAFDGARAKGVAGAPLLDQDGDDIRAALADRTGWPAAGNGAAAPQAAVGGARQ
jgi:crotonobetainyl-CoA:carnitine CoA-transferase CaiB-like acyl-CoA transferase